MDITINVKLRDGSSTAVQSRRGQDTVMQVLYDEDLGVEAVCGGCASCATCHVFIEPEWAERLPPRDDIESMLLQYQEHFDPDRSRLSCQLKLSESLDGIAVEIAPEE